MFLIHTFANNHTQNHIYYGFALGAGAGRNVAPGKRVELPSGRNCFPECMKGAWLGQEALIVKKGPVPSSGFGYITLPHRTAFTPNHLRDHSRPVSFHVLP
jgi:hypothetical protein